MKQEVRHLMPIAPRPETLFVRGRGSWLWDRDGRRYLDFIQGWAVNALGHAPELIRTALNQQAARLINPGPAFYNEPMIALADQLAAASGLEHIFFANSGAEANEGAIKLARRWGEKYRGGAFGIVTMEHGFHGRTLATMSASGKAGWERLYEPKVPGFTKVPFNDIGAVARAIGPDTVAVMLELVQGEAGVIPAEPAYVQALRTLTEEQGILLIVDEVQTGIGRSGKFFACDHYGITPDILTLGKGIGGGVPLAALVARASVSCFEPGDQGGTFNGNPLMCAVGAAVVAEINRPEFLARINGAAAYLVERLETITAQFGLGAVRGLGLLQAIDTGGLSAGAVVERARARGLILNAPRDRLLRFMPALNVSHEEIDQMAALLAEAIEEERGSATACE